MRSEKSKLYAVCKCSCGNVCTVRYDSLLSGKTISCGCINKKNLIQPLDLTSKANKYGCTAIKQLEKHSDSYFWLCKCSCGKEFVVLAKNFPKVKSCGCAQTRARKRIYRKPRKHFLTDVWKIPLCIVLNRKNAKNNTSGVRGITYDRTAQKWQAQIVFKGKLINLEGI